MQWWQSAGHEILGLLVDDKSFAIVILAWLALFWGASPYLPLSPIWHGPILFGGFAAILIGSTLHRAWKP